MEINEEPAFPHWTPTKANPDTQVHSGLSKREYFVLEMAKAWRTKNPTEDNGYQCAVFYSAKSIANLAAKDADALLDKLSKQA